MKKLYSIGDTAKIIGVSVDTIRRWDEKGVINSIRVTDGGHRYFTEKEINSILTLHSPDVYSIAHTWASSKESYVPEQSYIYCSDSSVFQARLGKLSNKIKDVEGLKDEYPLITSIAGEMGNNSFDHNIGAWPDVRGIIFGYNLEGRYIIIADRGQGIFNTLKYVKPDLKNDIDSLGVAFTETISARVDQKRGNGLKFVRDVVTEVAEEVKINLTFITGNAILKLSKGDKDVKNKISTCEENIKGCFVRIDF